MGERCKYEDRHIDGPCVYCERDALKEELSEAWCQAYNLRPGLKEPEEDDLDTQIQRLHDAMATEIERLREELDDGNAAYRRVMEERCAGDEIHCTCVPHLRQGIAELKVRNAEVATEAGLLQRQRDVSRSEVALLRARVVRTEREIDLLNASLKGTNLRQLARWIERAADWLEWEAKQR